MISFTFPGQGSQKPAMGDAWTDHPSWELVDEASAAAGRDVAHLLLHADADELKATRNAQLSTFVASLVVLDAVERLGVDPSMVAGHSLGEYTALVASGALAFDDGVRLVAERGEAMQAAATERAGHHGRGARARRRPGRDGLRPDRRATSGWPTTTPPARWSSPARPTASTRASAAAKDLGAKSILSMAVSGAFHTPFMAPARDRLRAALAGVDLRAPDLPGVRQRRRPAPHRRRRVGRPARRPAVQPGALAPDAAPPRGGRRHHVRRARSRQRAHRHGQAHGDRGARPCRCPPPTSSTGCIETLAVARRRRRSGAHEGEHLFATERIVVSPAAGVFHPADGRRRRHHAGRRRRARRGRRRARCTPPSPADHGHAHRRGRAGRQPRAHRLAAGPLMRGLRITGWGAALPDKIVTNADLEATLDTSDAWITERTGIRERRIGSTTSALAIEAGPRGAASRPASTRPSVGHGGGGHLHARPGHAGHRRHRAGRPRRRRRRHGPQRRVLRVRLRPRHRGRAAGHRAPTGCCSSAPTP